MILWQNPFLELHKIWVLEVYGGCLAGCLGGVCAVSGGRGSGVAGSGMELLGVWGCQEGVWGVRQGYGGSLGGLEGVWRVSGGTRKVVGWA